MAVSAERLAAAWNAVWRADTPYDVRTAMQAGKRVGLIWFRPLEPLAFPRTGPIVILNRAPWGIVSVDFTKNQVSQCYKMENDGFAFQAGQDTFSAKIRFTELKYAGDYVVKRGRASGSAIKEAVGVLRGPMLGALEADDPNIALAQNYQQQLIDMSGGSGRFMIGTYYDYNDAYVQAFQNSQFANQWATYQTNKKTTQDFAAQTSNAAQAGNSNTVPVNQDPDYNLHAFAMQNFLAVTVHHQGNTNASTAVATFYNNYAQPTSSPPPTVQQVLTTVSTTPPPGSSLAALSANAPPGKLEPWMKEILEKTQPIVDAIVKEEDDAKRGVLLREQTGRPIQGQYRSYFAAGPLTVSGTVREGADGALTIQCTDLSGPTPMIDVKLGAFPGNLYPELQTALEKAEFLKAVLGKKVISALNGPAFLGYLSRMLTLATGEILGPLGP